MTSTQGGSLSASPAFGDVVRHHLGLLDAARFRPLLRRSGPGGAPDTRFGAAPVAADPRGGGRVTERRGGRHSRPGIPPTSTGVTGWAGGACGRLQFLPSEVLALLPPGVGQTLLQRGSGGETRGQAGKGGQGEPWGTGEGRPGDVSAVVVAFRRKCVYAVTAITYDWPLTCGGRVPSVPVGRRRSNFLPRKLSGPRTAAPRRIWKVARSSPCSPKEQVPSRPGGTETLRLCNRSGRNP